MEVVFVDKSVTFDTFVTSVAAKLATFMKEDSGDKPYLSQRQAFMQFGECNVRRWELERKIEPRRRPGRVEYPTARLKELSRVVQDYL